MKGTSGCMTQPSQSDRWMVGLSARTGKHTPNAKIRKTFGACKTEPSAKGPQAQNVSRPGITRTARARVSSTMLPSSLLRGRLRSALTKTGWFFRLISLASCCIVFFLEGTEPKLRNGPKASLAVRSVAERNANMLSYFIW